MTQTPGDRPRPTPRPRPGASARPSPRPRVAGSRRDREDADSTAIRTARPAPVPPQRPGRGGRPAGGQAAREQGWTSAPASADKPGGKAGTRTADRARTRAATRAGAKSRTSTQLAPRAAGGARRVALTAALTVLCLATAVLGGYLLWFRHPYVTSSVFAATRSNVQALYAFDYKNADRSVSGKLAVLSGPLHDQYAKDLKQGGIIDTYKQVSATTSYEVVDVGLQQINDAQDTATLVVFGQYVVKSVNSGNQPAPQGSECQVTPEGAQSCTQTVQVQTTKVGGTWKITQLSLLTTT